MSPGMQGRKAPFEEGGPKSCEEPKPSWRPESAYFAEWYGAALHAADPSGDAPRAPPGLSALQGGPPAVGGAVGGAAQDTVTAAGIVAAPAVGGTSVLVGSAAAAATPGPAKPPMSPVNPAPPGELPRDRTEAKASAVLPEPQSPEKNAPMSPGMRGGGDRLCAPF